MGGLGLGWWWAMSMMASSIIQNVALHQHHHWAIRAGMHARTATAAVVFEKSLRMSSAELQSAGSGQVVNLAQSDSQKIQFVFYFVAYLVGVPVQVALAVYLLWVQLGPASLVGLAVMILNIPVQRYLGGWMGALSRKAMGHADERVKRTSEMLQGVRVVKFFGLEVPFLSRISHARQQEVSYLRQVAYINGLNASFTDVVPVIVAVLSFLTFALASGETLTVGKAFTSLAIFDILRLPLLVTPMLSDAIAGAVVALDRLMQFLSRQDVQRYIRLEPEVASSTDKPPTIEIKASRFVWPEASLTEAKQAAAQEGKEAAAAAAAAGGVTDATSVPFEALEVPDLALPRGLITVVGSVGSGKTSLLAALTGEMTVEGFKADSHPVTVRLPGDTLKAVEAQQERAAAAWSSGQLGMPKDHDETNPASAVAMVGQEPWLLGATVEQNITFGRPFDQKRFDEVVRVCQLLDDLAAFPAGRHTEVGPSGNTTSGGQRARTCLARAVYADAPVVLLDDVLSAVDAHVARKLFDEVIRGVLKDRTVVLVSHQLQFVAASDLVIVVEKGVVSKPVTPAELVADVEARGDSHPLAGMFSAREEAAALMRRQAGGAGADEERAAEGAAAAEAVVAASATLGSVEAGAETEQIELVVAASGNQEPAAAAVATAEAPEAPGKGGGAAVVSDADKGRIVEAETRTTGAVRAVIYWRYAMMLSGIGASGVVIFLFAMTGARVGTDLWLSFWSSNAFSETLTYYLAVYAGVSAASVLAVIGYNFTWACSGVRASIHLHDALVGRVVRAPMGWFDATPAGRVLSRVSTDLATVDKQLVQTTSGFLKTVLIVAATLITQAVVQPYVLIGFVVALAFYAATAGYFRVSSRELKRLDNSTRAPVFSHFSQTLSGLSQGGLRAYGHQGRFLREAMALLDNNNKAFWKLNLVNRWLGVRLDIIGALIVGTTAFAAVGTTGTADPGLTGLSLSFALLVVSSLNWLVRGAVDTEQFMASVERVLEYSDHVRQEAPWTAGDEQGKAAALVAASLADEAGDSTAAALWRRRADVGPPPPGWPAAGALEVKDLVMRYNQKHSEPVLKGVTFSVKGGERVGVVGRTGGGKSSLIQCIFRTVEAESGTVSIDGCDIASLGVHDVRGALAIIPQDSVIFDATVRFNLAPGCSPGAPESPSDTAMLAALEQAQLETKVRELGGLDAEIDASMLSTGERQLLCIARAMLSRARIVVLDEATASVDSATDALIQKMIRSVFRGRTLLTVAHRLDTIADYDKILVLVAGKVVEFDAPDKLLKRPDSEYSQLVKQADMAGREKHPAQTGR